MFVDFSSKKWDIDSQTKLLPSNQMVKKYHARAKIQAK